MGGILQYDLDTQISHTLFRRTNAYQANLIAGDAEINLLVILMGLTYVVSTILGKLRYQ